MYRRLAIVFFHEVLKIMDVKTLVEMYMAELAILKSAEDAAKGIADLGFSCDKHWEFLDAHRRRVDALRNELKKRGS